MTEESKIRERLELFQLLQKSDEGRSFLVKMAQIGVREKWGSLENFISFVEENGFATKSEIAEFKKSLETGEATK